MQTNTFAVTNAFQGALKSTICSNSSVLNLLRNETACFKTMNNKILTMLGKLEKKLSELLGQCKCELTLVQEHIADHRSGQCQCERIDDRSVIYAKFSVPYFKSKHALPCPENEDCLKKIANQEFAITFKEPLREWKQNHRNKLQNAVVASEIKKRIERVNEEREHLLNSIAETDKPEEKAELKEKLRACKSAEEIGGMTPEELCTTVLESEHNWVVLSNEVFRGRYTPEECRSMWCNYIHPNIRKTRWTQNEDVMLKEAAAKYKYQNWDAIAKELGTGRTALQCAVQYLSRIHVELSSKGPWTVEEDELLNYTMQSLERDSKIPWHIVSNCIDGRTKKEVWQHWTYTVNPLIRKGPFTKGEDLLLIAAVRKYGKNFGKVAQLFQNRTSAQLHNRYTMVLECSKIKASWTPQDDALLLHLVKQYGEGNWWKISNHFLYFNRTQVRQHYSALQNKQKATNASEDGQTMSKKESGDCVSEAKLIEGSYNLAHGSQSNDIDKKTLKQTLLPIKRGRKTGTKNSYCSSDQMCIHYFSFMPKTPCYKEVPQLYESEKIEKQFHQLSCALNVLQASLLIPDHAKHHLLSDMDKQIIPLLRNRHLISTTQTSSSESMVCKSETTVEQVPLEPLRSEDNSGTENSVMFTIPPNYTTLLGFHTLNVQQRYLQSLIADGAERDNNLLVDEKKVISYEQACTLFCQRLFCIFFWPTLTSEVEPNISKEAGKSNESALVRVKKKIQPSRIRKRKSLWLKKEKNTDAEPAIKKRKYEKSGKYKKETATFSEVRRSSRFSSSASQ